MIERGVRNPSLEVIHKLARGLETTPASLVAEADQEEQGG